MSINRRLSVARGKSKKKEDFPSLVQIVNEENVKPEKLHNRRVVLRAVNEFKIAYLSGDYAKAEYWFRELEEVYTAPKSRKDTYIHPSELFHGCPRKMFYRVSGYEETDNVIVEHTAETRRTFDVGTFYHRYIQKLLKRSSHLSFTDEVPILNEARKLKGNTDGVIYFIEISGVKVILEIKTINDYGYGVVVRQNSPHDYHVAQASIYAKELDAEWICFLYVNKNNSQMKDFYVNVSDPKYKPLQDDAYEKIDRVLKAVETKKPPMRRCSSELDAEAFKCPYFSECFHK